MTVSSEGMPTVQADDDGIPEFTFPEGKPPADMQVSVLEEGKGREIEPEDFLIVNYVGQVWDADEPFDMSYNTGEPASFPLPNLVPGWAYTLTGRHVGDKVIISLPPEYGYQEAGNQRAGIGGEDTIVFYIEVVDGWSADSAGQEDATVETDDSELPVQIDGDIGHPVTSLDVKDQQDEPTEQTSKIIAKGSGPEVTGQGSRVFIAYAATSWDGEVVENSWTGIPASVSGPQTITLGGGTVFDALDGATVGSRMLLLLPKSDGSETQVSSPSMAVVVDVLGFQPAASAPEEPSEAETD
ncbi:FKBP-type peptidyl-prolyl cis-trans isomerase [Actinomycetaceae bacterium L2_0104]